MDIKLLALDLDDTLLDEQTMITPRGEKAVRMASGMGIKVVLTTGRNYACTEKFSRQLGLDTPVITNGGAEIYNASGKMIYSRYLAPEMAKEVIDFAIEEGVHFQTYREECFCYEKENEYCALYRSFNGLKGLEIPDLRHQKNETPKVLLIASEERISELKDKAVRKFGERFNISISKPWYLEFNRPDASKGLALKYLCELYGLQKESVMAMGDGQIDLSMIEYAGLGIAMANSGGTVRDKADFITDSNSEDGAAKAIERFIMGGKPV
jgi:Cof subfamily protein (haloacid dehalogenase superfamily)